MKYNPVYKAGKVSASCAKGLKKGTTKAATKKYLTDLVGCLNTAWAPRFKAAGLSFDTARVGISDSLESCGTGDAIKSRTSRASYCHKTIQVGLKSDWIKARDDLSILPAVTYAYSKHLGMLTGIEEAAFSLPIDVMDSDEQMHRRALQWDCLGAVFMKGVWTAQKRPARDWKALVTRVRKTEESKLGWYGKAASRAYWLNTGFATGNPASCNTWKAPAAKVA